MQPLKPDVVLRVNSRERNRDGRNGHEDRRAAGFDMRATLSRYMCSPSSLHPCVPVAYSPSLLLSAGTAHGLDPVHLAMTAAIGMTAAGVSLDWFPLTN